MSLELKVGVGSGAAVRVMACNAKRMAVTEIPGGRIGQYEFACLAIRLIETGLQASIDRQEQG